MPFFAVGANYWVPNLASLAKDGRLVLLGLLSGGDVPKVSGPPRSRISNSRSHTDCSPPSGRAVLPRANPVQASPDRGHHPPLAHARVPGEPAAGVCREGARQGVWQLRGQQDGHGACHPQGEPSRVRRKVLADGSCGFSGWGQVYPWTEIVHAHEEMEAAKNTVGHPVELDPPPVAQSADVLLIATTQGKIICEVK